MTKRKDIHVGRRGIAAGTAVAAALLAVNVGGAYLLFSGSSKPETSQVAMSEQIEEQQPCAALPLYAERMQQYYTQKSGIPCDYDFANCGKDFNISAENEDWRITLKAITGCSWMIYYFYDVEPLKGQTFEEFYDLYPEVHIAVRQDGRINADLNHTDLMPVQKESQELDNGVWHCCGTVPNRTGTPFREAGTTLDYTFLLYDNEENKTGSIECDFLYPDYLTPANEDEPYLIYNAATVMSTNTLHDKVPTQAELDFGEIGLTQCSMTPFGVFYIGEFDAGDAQGWSESFYTKLDPNVNFYFENQIKFTLQNADNGPLEDIDTFGASDESYCGTTRMDDKSVAFVNIQFDHPWDGEKGQLSAEPVNSISGKEQRAEAGGEGPVDIYAYTKSDDPDGRIMWKNNDGDTTIEFTYEIDLGDADCAKWIDFKAMEAMDEGDPMPLVFRYELTAPDGHPFGDSSTLISGFTVKLEPAEQPYTLTVHVQPVGDNGDGIAAEEFILNNQITVSDTEDGDPTQKFMFSTAAFQDPDFKYDGAYTVSYGLYDTADNTKPTIETLEYSESENQLFLNAHLTGHGTAEGETYNLYVKAYQDTEDGSTPVLLALTPDGEKQDGVWINDLPQGDLNHVFNSLFMELQTDIGESKITFELWYQPDNIQPERMHFTDIDGGFLYFAHHYIALPANCTPSAE